MSESDSTDKPTLEVVKDKRDTTAHIVTRKKQRFVRSSIRAKITQKRIAEAMQVSIPTLKKYYTNELKKGEIDLPELAVNKLYKYLNRDIDASNLEAQEKQAKMAEKVLRSHGWKPSLEEGSLAELPRILVSVKKPTSG